MDTAKTSLAILGAGGAIAVVAAILAPSKIRGASLAPGAQPKIDPNASPPPKEPILVKLPVEGVQPNVEAAVGQPIDIAPTVALPEGYEWAMQYVDANTIPDIQIAGPQTWRLVFKAKGTALVSIIAYKHAQAEGVSLPWTDFKASPIGPYAFYVTVK